ncbi:eukaryotic translation initiation factor 3 subunit C isoform X2 [Lingula anatina]|uniref:Eukaryotic translation initiation factor 3 subunit C n=1 Tax=Lingula anatina TaxID=7574 RepID=A0A1S3INV3_LINAN|nr:eukaryotic translation initiation factor 3 subunit C isoform X2 [Lingula anatina]|eukprot:XP_013399925.1 eukaryotic translation initiation factor 3 subunit C isoform X2 [Lingula anatina]
MSRFFAASESESESESSEGEDIPVVKPVAGKVAQAFTFSDDEEDTKRVVRSAKDKRYEEIRNIIKQLKNHKKIKDMSNVLSDFEDLGRAYDKAKKVVEKEGIPRFYLRALVELEDFVSECWEDREARKQLSKNNAKSLTTLRQKLKKYNRDFEQGISDYRENPDQDEEEEGSDDEERDSDEEEEDDDDDKDENDTQMIADFIKKPPPSKPNVSKFLKDGDEDSGDESDWGDESDESSELSSDDEKYGGNLALKFLKKTTEQEKAKKDAKKKEVKERKQTKKVDKAQDEDEGEWEQVKGGAPMIAEKPKMFGKDVEINHKVVCMKLIEIVAARGKKGTDRNEQINMLIELNSIASENNLGPAMEAKIMFNIAAALFDYNPNIATCMRAEMWERCIEFVLELLNLLITNKEISVGEDITEESEQLEVAPYLVRGCILTVVERMDEEFTKMLQGCDAHSTEYVERLRDEKKVCDIIDRLVVYLEGRSSNEELCRAYLKKIQHLYYKYEPVSPEGQKNSEEVMETLCRFIHTKDQTDRIRTNAILCQIYHHAIHDRWYQARDLMMMSHLQDTIHHSDVPLQILYNRAMVQLGLCAFRQGMIKDAHHCLVDIQSGGRAKELLAQGLLLQRQHERTPEQEKIEKRRQMPYHMHINLELLECVYLVSAMLMEIPYMAAHEFDARRRMISKNFHHVMRVSERNPLVGPPESMREHIVAASKAMKVGDWKACRDYAINEKMNKKVWDLFQNTAETCEMIVSKIQEESLRTYLFTYSSVYDSLSMDNMAEMFELPKATVHSIISKMIINEELMASLDEPTQTVVMHRTEPTRLQSLALQLAEKVATLVENNERIMEQKMGSFFTYQKQGQQGGFQGRGDRQNRGGAGGYQQYGRGDRNQNREGGRQGYQGNRGGQGGYQGNRDRQQNRGQRRDQRQY